MKCERDNLQNTNSISFQSNLMSLALSYLYFTKFCVLRSQNNDLFRHVDGKIQEDDGLHHSVGDMRPGERHLRFPEQGHQDASR